MTTLGLYDVRKRLKSAVADAGSAAVLARKHGINASQISRTLKGDKPASSVLKALGLREVERAPRFEEAK